MKWDENAKVVILFCEQTFRMIRGHFGSNEGGGIATNSTDVQDLIIIHKMTEFRYKKSSSDTVCLGHRSENKI